MSILIKGMEVPKSCSKCGWFDMGGGDGYQCTLLQKSFDMWNKISVARDKSCPLISIPTPHGRLIDADAFKDYIRNALEETKHIYKDNGAWAKEITESFCKDIDEQPTIIPEPHWIPCSERLPEKDGRYYVTLENKYVGILYYAVEQTIRHPKGFYYLSEDGRMTWRQTQNTVVAWMPLPSPFKWGVTE